MSPLVRRTSVRVLTSVLAVALTATPGAWAVGASTSAWAVGASTPARNTGAIDGVFVHPRAPGAGTVVRVAPLADDLRLAGSVRSLRLWYRSTSWNGAGSIVTGTLDLPLGRPPKGGWPVVSYAHGMTGVADACAPSVSGQWPNEKAMIESLLADGYAIVATDYQGLGAPGATFPGEGNSEAYNVVDIVRAARTLAPLSRSWTAVGYSAGGHAVLFTGALARRYAPELDYRGTVALAPVSQWRVQMQSPASGDPTAPVSFTGLYWDTSAAELNPGRFVPEEIFTERGLRILDQARTLCVLDFLAALGGVTNGDVYRDPAATASLTAGLLADDEIPAVRFSRPVRIAQGSSDPLMPLTDITVAQLRQAGNDLVYLPVEGADHTTLATTIGPQLRTWVRDLFAQRR